VSVHDILEIYTSKQVLVGFDIAIVVVSADGWIVVLLREKP
jgi:hypothetical protein